MATTDHKNISDAFAKSLKEMLSGESESNSYLVSIIKKMKNTTYVQPGEVPNIDLYMDQVTKFMDEHLESSKRRSDDKLLTKTMINNYTKNNLLPSPNKKKYTKDHMYTMLFIYYLKNVMPMDDTQSVLQPLTDLFFGENGSIDMEGIYKEIFDIEYDQSYSLTRDVVRKYNRSKKSFLEVDDGKEREFLQAFTFIAMLCFDVYMKKTMIEKIIDDNFSLSSMNRPEAPENKKEDKHSDKHSKRKE